MTVPDHSKVEAALEDEMNDLNRTLATDDAAVWAREWTRIAREIEAAADGREVIDEGWMTGWFANAIETAKDIMARRLPTPTEPTDLICDGNCDHAIHQPEHIAIRAAELAGRVQTEEKP